MDLSTGERWARLVQDEDDTDRQGVVVDAALDNTGALTITNGPTEEDEVGENIADIKPSRDYDMMHRVMSNLPPEELERFGGLPALPVPKQTHDKEAVLSISSEERAEFEARMEELWMLRQEELRKFQEDNLADIPSLLKDRIGVLKEYLGNPLSGRKKVLRKREKQIDEIDRSTGEDAQEDAVVADDIIECLKDLEYQLSDIDHARDFHTLGGWPYLVALLHEQVHLLCNEESDVDRSLMYEIQSLASMTIGTAVGNLGEFFSWALEDVSSTIRGILKDQSKQLDTEAYQRADCNETHQLSFDGPVSAVFSLLDSFRLDVSRRSTPTYQKVETLVQNDVRNSLRTFKLRAVYALGSLLRGNTSAQQYFVIKDGPNALVHYTLGILSSVNGENGVSKLDYKLASKVLALGEDVVMNVLLQEDDYAQHKDDGSSISVSPNRIVAAFTTEPWCDLSLRMLSPPIKLVGESQARNIKERALSAIRALGPACKANSQLQCSSNVGQECTQESLSWGTSQVRRIKSEWNREGSGDGLDSVYRRELLDLIDSVLEALQ